MRVSTCSCVCVQCARTDGLILMSPERGEREEREEREERGEGEERDMEKASASADQ